MKKIWAIFIILILTGNYIHAGNINQALILLKRAIVARDEGKINKAIEEYLKAFTVDNRVVQYDSKGVLELTLKNMSRLQREVARLNVQKKQLEMKITRLQEEKNALLAEIDKAKSEITRAANNGPASESEIASLKEEIEQLKEQIEYFRKYRNVWRARYRRLKEGGD